MKMALTVSIGEVDAFLSETGQFSVVEWLLSQNVLPYGDYEQWRNGDLAVLESAFKCSAQILGDALSDVASKAQHLKLVSQEQTYFSWQGEQKHLLLSRDAAFNKSLSLVWKRPEDLPQMDLFMDNSAVVCENQVQFDLAARDYSRAQQALQKLTDLNPSHAKLGVYQDLINYGLHILALPTIAEGDLSAELEGLQNEVAPLAKEALKGHARDYLAAPWRRLAGSFSVLGGTAPWPLHQSFALSQIPDWLAVKESLLKCERVYNSPEKMHLLATAYFYSDEPNTGFLMWGIIAEYYPDYADSNMDERNITLIELWDSFLAFDEHWPNEWFLSYLLIQRPGLLHLLEYLPVSSTTGQSPIKNPVNQTTLALIKAKINDEDQNLHRAKLKSSAPALLKCFMNKRDWLQSMGKRRF